MDAREKQCGINLKERKQAMPIVVIDHVERVPADN